jgi:hypothetical protein
MQMFLKKSCPHDQFVLNYDLTTKLYLSRLSGTYSESENPNLTGQVQPLTRQVRSGIPPDKSGPFT